MSTPVKGIGWHIGIIADVFFAAIIAATWATANTSPFLLVPSVICEWMASLTRIEDAAMAVLIVSTFIGNVDHLRTSLFVKMCEFRQWIHSFRTSIIVVYQKNVRGQHGGNEKTDSGSRGSSACNGAYTYHWDRNWFPSNIHMEEFLPNQSLPQHDVPSFDRSPYDGFAVRAQDTAGASGDNRVAFDVIGEIGAGYVADRAIGEMESIPNYDGCTDS